jgi:hypothetical protein
MKYDNIIAIDPDCCKSGVAYLKVKTRQLEAQNLSFPELLEYLKAVRSLCVIGSLIVVVEAGWLVKKSNFGKWNRKGSKETGERIAKNVGANHETGRKIVEMCQYYGITVQLQQPLRKCWRGPDGKITQDELAYFTGIDGRMNQDLRDACLIAWNYAGFPIKMKPMSV